VTFKPVYYSSQDGLQLYARIYGATNTADKTVVCLAGLTRNSRDFDGLAVHLARAGFRVVTLDMRGRGNSEYAKDAATYTIVQEAQDVLAGLSALGIEYASFIGTSRGGLIMHVLAAMRPAIMRLVVLNDIGPVIEPDGLLQIRGYLENAPKPKDWADAAAIQKLVHGKAFPALSDEDWERHARAIYKQNADGNIVSDFDLKIADSLRALRADTPLPAIWFQFQGLTNVPMLAIRGSNSRLLSEKTHHEMGKRHPNCTLFTAEGQGHAPMLDTSDLPQRITNFLSKV
jgi:pimeloyl-ACP methyl ester carboxylesterase